jgi:4-amino-4-deoxy-L-arabinose transferase-like glycosyltransferase
MGRNSSRYGAVLLFIILYALFAASTAFTTAEWSADEILYLNGGLIMHEGGELLTHMDITGVPRFQKPPLYYWLVAASYKIIGVSLFSARFPAILSACVVLFYIYLLASGGGYDHGRGMMSMYVLSGAYVFFYHARTGVTDVTMTAGIVAGLYYILSFLEGRTGNSSLYKAAVALGLAAMAKGPIALVFTGGGLLLFLLFSRRSSDDLPGLRDLKPFILPLLLLLLLAGWWYALMAYKYGSTFLGHQAGTEVAARIDSSLAGRFYSIRYYAEKLVVSNYPWSILFAVLLFWKISPGGPGIPRRLSLAFSTFLLIFYVILIWRTTSRYLVPMLPFLAVLCADYFVFVLENGTSPIREKFVFLARALSLFYVGIFVTALILTMVAARHDLTAAALIILICYICGSAWLCFVMTRKNGSTAGAVALSLLLVFSGSIVIFKDLFTSRPGVEAALKSRQTGPGSTLSMDGLDYLERGYLYFYGDRSRLLPWKKGSGATHRIIRADRHDPESQEIIHTVRYSKQPDVKSLAAAMGSGNLLSSRSQTDAYHLVRVLQKPNSHGS